jgi:rhodanese-related sulfurtransferase
MTFKTISPEKLYEKMKNQEDILLLDVRSEDKYNDFHIEDPRIEMLNIQKK